MREQYLFKYEYPYQLELGDVIFVVWLKRISRKLLSLGK